MHNAWVKGLTGKDKEAEKKRIEGNRTVLHEAAEILEGLIETGTPDYDCPNWAHKQADRNGANRKLREVINFLKV